MRSDAPGACAARWAKRASAATARAASRKVLRLLRAFVAGPHAVDNPAATEVVRGELDADAVARIHANPKAAHLARGVTERLVTVVELDAEHAVPQRLDDLAGHLDLLFFL